jgi:hypothetical protein
MLDKIQSFNSLVDLIENFSENKYRPITSAKVDLWIEEDDFGEPVTRIDSIKVPKLKRYKGEGKKEVENIIKWSLEQGSKEIVIESERDAISFWKKMGFDINDQGNEVSTGILKLTDNERFNHK